MDPSLSKSPNGMDDLTQYDPLYRAIRDGNLESVKKLCESNASALEARITANSDTALHVAVGAGAAANDIVKYLVNRMSEAQVALKNKDGNTVLSIAAISCNVEAAQMIMKKWPDLNHVANESHRIPLVEAARYGHKDMIDYLLQFNENYFQPADILKDKTGVVFVNFVIIAGFYDVALDLVKRHPSLATTEFNNGESLLYTIATKLSEFPSGRKLDFLQHDIISLIAISIRALKSGTTASRNQKVLNELVEWLCKTVTRNSDHERASSILKRPFLLAAESGVHEVVEAIIWYFPSAVWFSDEKNRNAFHLAVKNRHKKVFNIISQMSIGHKNMLLMSKDKSENNILHLAGKLAPKHELKHITGAALQIQSELQWFKKIEKIVLPACREDKNSKGETPAMVFAKKHKELLEEGEKWMKGAATACSVAAALITTIVFAAAITVPGGNSNDGQPTFYKERAFKIFGISDALSLLASMASILMFLSVLTARYAEDDFLYVLPMRFMSALFLLLLSAASMMITSVITVYLVFSDRKAGIFSTVVLYAVLLAYLFTYTQVPLLAQMFISTLRPTYFT